MIKCLGFYCRFKLDLTCSRDEVLAGKALVPYFYVPMCIGLWVLCFSRSFCMACTSASSLVCLVRWSHAGFAALKLKSAGQRFVWWCAVEEVHVSPCLCGSVESLQHQYNPGGFHFREETECCWSSCICFVTAWRVACPQRRFCLLLWKWLPYEACGVPNFWSPVVEALLPAKCCVCIWEHWPVLSDGVSGELLEGRGDSGLGGVSSRIRKGDYHKWHVNARPSRYGGELH